MAAFDHFRDLYDVALKPRLLRSLLKEQVPDETRPLRNPSELSFIVSAVKTHKLLSEEIPHSADRKHVSNWMFAIDAWFDRILMLAGSNLPDKCWAGVCLLGLTCTECSYERFLASYSDCFNVLVSHVQEPSGVSQFVRVASCAAMSDLLTRLGGFSNLKKDGTSYAGKLVQLVLKMLNEDVTEALLEVAAHLLSTVLTYFPSSVHRHHDNAEGIILSKIMSGNYSANVLKKLSCCLASLPKSRGDDESWSLMMQKILLSVSALLNRALEGLEEESSRGEAIILLVPPGKDPPPSLGGQIMNRDSLNNGDRSHQWLISTILSLMQCCCTMLTSSYPVQVPVPVRPLLATIRRVLMVNGSLPETLQPFTTAVQQEFVCLQLPALHLNVLEVLGAVVNGLRSQLLLHAADIMWLLMEYFKRCWLPELRTKVYSIFRVLLISLGAGMALYISQEVVHNGSIDLKFADSGCDGAPSTEQSCAEASLRHHLKKRKHGAATGSLVEKHGSLSMKLEAPKECQASIALKIAAVEALEALIVVGGALRSDSWRRRVDHLLLEVATNACRGGWTHAEKPVLLKEHKVAWEDFQFVAIRALLASLLSPAGVRPSYLTQGLELFHKGKLNTGTKVAEFCAQALLVLEVLIHPRALPLIDIPLPTGNSYSVGGTDIGGLKYKSPQADGMLRTVDSNTYDVYDFLNDIYMENGSGSEVPAAEVHKDLQFDGKRLHISRDGNLEEPNVVSGSSDRVTPRERDDGSESAELIDKIEAKYDDVMLDVQHHDKPDKTSVEAVLHDGDTVPIPVSSMAEKGFGNDKSDADASDLLNRTSESGQHVPAAMGIASTGVNSVVIARADSNTKLSVLEEDDESSDSFPDIVDAEPDTDSDSE